MRNIYLVIVMFLTLVSNSVQADGLYLGLGMGYVWEVPVQSEASITQDGQVIFQEQLNHQVDLDGPFGLFTAGMEINNYHLEMEIMGVGSDSEDQIRTIRFYKRWYIYDF